MDRTLYRFPCEIIYNKTKVSIIILVRIDKSGTVHYTTTCSKSRKFHYLQIVRSNNALTKFHIIDSKFTEKETQEIEIQLTEIIRMDHGLV
jgi:hypothetical protein